MSAAPPECPEAQIAQNGPRVVSLGCRLNLAEGETVRRLAAAAGLDERTIVVNSCAVTQEAVRRTGQTLRRLRRDNPAARLVVTGCAAQIDPAGFAAMDAIDAVIGNAEKLDAEVWSGLAAAAPMERVLVNDIMSVRDTAGHMIDAYGDRARAFLQVQNGCDHRCTFCVIPFGRGNSRSAPIEVVLQQARRLVENGHKELVLTGVDITSWGQDLDGAPKLGDLVAAVLDEAPELFRLRLSSIDGAELDDRLRERIAGDERIAPHLHLSVQSGDDLILKRMKRRHTRDDIIRLCSDLRARRPDIAFGADIIAGFPTETEAMFLNSVKLIEDAGIVHLHVFPFSPREGTPAARMPQTARETVKRRAAILRARGAAAKGRFLSTLVGRVETGVAESGGRVRLGNFAEAAVPGTPPPDGLWRVRITGQDRDMLTGVPLEENARAD